MIRHLDQLYAKFKKYKFNSFQKLHGNGCDLLMQGQYRNQKWPLSWP